MQPNNLKMVGLIMLCFLEIAFLCIAISLTKVAVSRNNGDCGFGAFLAYLVVIVGAIMIAAVSGLMPLAH